MGQYSGRLAPAERAQWLPLTRTERAAAQRLHTRRLRYAEGGTGPPRWTAAEMAAAVASMPPLAIGSGTPVSQET
jgi:hypothetical protein